MTSQLAASTASQARPCAVCGSTEKTRLFQQRFTNISGGSLLTGYDVVACRHCGFCFADQLPPRAAFDVYYSELSKYERQENQGQMTDYDQRRFPVAAKLIHTYVPDLQARILDIGCSTGGLLFTLKQLGYQNLLGIDPSPLCAQVAQTQHQIRVLTGTLANLPGDIGRFDVIILGAVLEHLPDLEFAITSITPLLAEAGHLYVDVPDATTFASLPDAPYQEFSSEHINFFSPRSLVNLFQAHGFSALHSERVSIEQSPGKMGNEVKALFQVTDRRRPPLQRDDETEAALLAYIANSRRDEARLHQIIDAWVVSGQPILVWGVGTHTQRLLATSRLSQANIRAFIDSNPRYQGKQLNGIDIIAPTDLPHWPQPILISSRVFQQEIAQQIRHELKLGNDIIVLYEM
jgi:SAM-dependent methyltransferase